MKTKTLIFTIAIGIAVGAGIAWFGADIATKKGEQMALKTSPSMGLSDDNVDFAVWGAKFPDYLDMYMQMKDSGKFVTEFAGSYPYPGGNIYGATKAFVKQFSLNLRADLYDKNIRITNIEPGLAMSEFSLVRFKGDTKRASKLYENANALQPEDIAQSVFFAATLPQHVNINRIELMPTTQAPAALNVYKG